MNNNEELCEWQRANSIVADKIKKMLIRNSELEFLVTSIAHIGVDEYGLQNWHISKARELIKQGE